MSYTHVCDDCTKRWHCYTASCRRCTARMIARWPAKSRDAWLLTHDNDEFRAMIDDERAKDAAAT